jgi:hypothetical protein
LELGEARTEALVTMTAFNIEARAFKPEDFNAGDPLASEIRRTGVQVA